LTCGYVDGEAACHVPRAEPKGNHAILPWPTNAGLTRAICRFILNVVLRTGDITYKNKSLATRYVVTGDVRVSFVVTLGMTVGTAISRSTIKNVSMVVQALLAAPITPCLCEHFAQP
jgi:hypothetical protein